MGRTHWVESADKHSVERADALNAMRSARIYLVGFDVARVGGGGSVDLFIGPNRAGTELIEVMAHVDRARETIVIFHVMPARLSTLERARRIFEERGITP